ncbi:MAG: CGNR zinc finger domain-containing protein [Planctomycetota bacterium]|jgi:hypothetical protein
MNEQVERKNQPLFIDFYNLHLDCCLTIVPQNEIDTNEFWYRIETPEDEREEMEAEVLIRSIEVPIDILQYTWKAKHWVKRGNQFVLARQENIDEKDISYPVFPKQKWAGKLAIVAINPPSTETKSKITEFFRGIPELWKRLFTSIVGSMEDYKYTHDIDWYESKDFLDFMFDYFCFRNLIDGYLEGKIQTWTLEWLQEKIQNYRYSLLIYKDNEQVRTTTLGDEIVIDSLNFKSQGIQIKGLPYGLGLAIFSANIHSQVVQTLEEKREIKRCQAPETQKTPACQNMFIPLAMGKEQKYCSTKCANRARRLKYYSKTGK